MDELTKDQLAKLPPELREAWERCEKDNHHVAYASFKRLGAAPAWLKLCDSDYPGAFKLYRRDPVLPLALRLVAEQAAEIQRLRTDITRLERLADAALGGRDA